MRKRSNYKPKPFMIPSVIRFSQAAETDLCLIPQAELTKFREGTADEISINSIVARLNLGYVVAGEYINEPEAKQTMELALDAIRSVKARHETTGKVGATGDEYHIIADGLNLTDQMQALCTRKELHSAMTYVFEKAGKK
jgi:uncharacterized protein YacL (UPF0231 family)